MKFILFIIFLISSSSPLWAQENRLVLYSGNPEERVQPFDTLMYEDMTAMVLKITSVAHVDKYDWLRVILTCKLENGGRKALRPKEYHAQLDIPLDKSSLMDSDPLSVIVFDENGYSDFDEKMKRKFKNFSIAPTRRRWLKYWAAYQYQFRLYGFQKSNVPQNGTNIGNSLEGEPDQVDLLGMSSTFYVQSSKRKRPRVGILFFLRQFFGKE